MALINYDMPSLIMTCTIFFIIVIFLVKKINMVIITSVSIIKVNFLYRNLLLSRFLKYNKLIIMTNNFFLCL